jgi:hypothetical protein
MLNVIPGINRVPMSEIPVWLFLAVVVIVLGPVVLRRIRGKR